jgi:MSHA biogenesis protein MshI
MNMLTQWLRKKDADLNTAVCIEPGGVSFAEVRWAHGRPRLIACDFRPTLANDANAALQQAAKQAGARDCATVMPLGSYSLLLIEAPEVPAPELRAAVRWRIRDLIDFHIDDAVLDVFDAPASGARGQTHLYVVVSRNSEVKALADRLQDAGIKLGVIDIPELALRNIAARLPEDEQGVALLYFGEQRGVIALCRNQTLYLARTLDVGRERLREAVADGHTEALFDSLALEMQRSLDYYDRHFQQAPIGNLVIAPLGEPLPGLVDSLRGNIGLNVRMLELAEVVDGAEKATPEQASACLLTLGAALRRETKTL